MDKWIRVVGGRTDLLTQETKRARMIDVLAANLA